MAQKNIEFGALASFSRFSYSIDSRTNPAKTFFEPWHYPFTGYDTYVLAERAITIQFYATKKFGKGKLQPYAGGAVGQGRFYIDKPMNERADVNTDVYYGRSKTKTFQLSALVGCNYRITKRVSANVEVTGNYIVGYDIKLDYYNHYYSTPVTIGVNYTLF
ncbi:MAG: hypothetical protein JNL72_01300 [Flavipsychrobacter sp.]|nr:hypothetical protein [Flavipsychrobacter sp.]